MAATPTVSIDWDVVLDEHERKYKTRPTSIEEHIVDQATGDLRDLAMEGVHRAVETMINGLGEQIQAEIAAKIEQRIEDRFTKPF